MSLFKKVQHISVTLDFLRQFADLDVKKDADLHIALHRVGFQVIDKENKPVKVEFLTNVNVRCQDKPYLYRKTTVFVGNMREDFAAARIYDNIDILDVQTCKTPVTDFVNELPYEIPVLDKPNTRKYTKRKDVTPCLEGITPDELDNFSDIYGG